MSKVVAELVVDGQQVFIRQLDDAEEAVEGVGDGADRSSKKLSGFASAMGALGGALATRELVQWGRDAADYATELGAMQRKADTVFGEAVSDIRDFSEEHASRFGLAEDALTGLAAGYGDLLVPMGFTRDQAAELTGQTLELAGALGEWSPQLGGAQHALEALGAAMTGEREQLKAYGIVIDEAAVKAELLARGQQDLTGEAERQATAMATLDLALRGSADAQAQFAAGGDPAVVAANEAKASYEQMRAELGENLLPVMSAVHGIVGDVTGVFADMPEPVQTAALVLAGVGTAAVPIASVASAIGNLGEMAGGLRGRMSGAASFITGPWGLAIAGAITAVGLFAKAKADARAEVQEYVRALEADSGALAENVRAHVVAELSNRGLLEQADMLGVSVSTLTDAIMGNEQAYDSIAPRLDYHIRALGDTTNNSGAMRDAALDLRDALQGESSELENSIRTYDLQMEALESSTTLTWDLADASHASMGAAIAHAEALSRGTGVASTHDSAIAGLVRAQQDLARETQVATRSLQDQIDAQRAAVDPVFAAASAQRGLAEAQTRLTEVQNDEKATAADVAVAHQDVASAAIDLQGALVELTEAQGTGVTSSAGFREALQLMVEQGLIAQGTVDALTGGFGGLEGAARRAAEAMLEASINAGDFGYVDSFVRQATRGSGGGVIEDLPGSGSLADYSATPVSITAGTTSTRSIQVGDIVVHVGSATDGRTVGAEVRDGVRAALIDVLEDEAAR